MGTILAFAVGFALAWTIRPVQLLASFARHARWIGPLYCLAVAAACAGEPVNASYRVAVRQGNSSDLGSGTAINRNWLITCRHVVAGAGLHGRVELTNARGTLTGEVVQTDEPSDVALVYCSAGFAEWVDLAEADPRAGDKVTIYGYGRSGILRGGVGTLTKLAGYRESGAQRTPVYESSLAIQSGDSGSGMFNAAGELCGLNWGSDDPNGPSDGIEGPSQSTGAVAIRAQCVRYETQCSGPWCPVITPRQRPPQFQPQRPGGGTLVPVTPSTAPPQPQQPTAPQQPAGKPCECDPAALDKRLSEIEKQIASLATTPSARPCTCDPAAQQAAMEKAIKDAIAGIKFPDAPPAPADEVTHFVVVADSAAPDSRRLNEYVGKAKEVYSGIKTADLPKYPIGPVPQLVEFRGAQAVRVVKGKQAVEERLYRIARGEYPAQ